MSSTVYALCIPDEHYEHLVKLVNESKTGETFLKDKAGITQRFYKEEEVIYADKEERDGNILKQKVITNSEALKMGSKDKYRSKIEERVKEDFPDMTSEEVKAHADVLNEANESVKRLIDNGMPKALAVKLISMIVEGNKEFSSPEELAEFMKEEVASEPDEDNSVVEAVKNIIVSSETIPNASGIEYWRRIGGE
jgi:hypothetical protein